MISPLDTDVAIETPEHIVFRYRVGGPARRLMAYAVDLFLCYGALLLIGIVVGLAAMGGSSLVDEIGGSIKAGLGLWLLLLFFVQWVYFVAWEALRGTTPGKMAAGLRVVTVAGRPIGFRAAALRNLLRAADALPVAYVVGVVAMAISRKFQRLGDLVAGTIVIVAESTRRSRPLVLFPPAQPSELANLPEEVALDPDERAAIELFLRRRSTLGAAREHELATMVVASLRERFGFRVDDPSRTLALLYDRAANAGRSESPPSSRGPASWR